MTGYVGDTNNGPAAFAAGDPVLYQTLVEKANAASVDDDLLNAEELERFMESIIPGDVSPETAQRLINIYGNGTVVSTKSIVEDMTMDGFLKAVPGDSYFSLAWGYDWDAIDGSKIGDALFRVMGLDPATSTMTAGEFDEATDRLFGDREGLSPENAEFLTRNFGTGGTLNRDQLATIFEGDHIHIDGVPGENYIRVFVNGTIDTLPFSDTTQAANYIMSYDGNGDRILDRNEFRAALESRMSDESTLSDGLLDDYMNFYGFTYPNGDRVLDVNGVNAMLTDTSLYLAPRGPDGGQGFGINLNITPIERVIRGASLDDDMLSHDELARLFEKLGLEARDPAQMDFLMKVYGNGDVVDVVTIMGAMQEDGFLTLPPNMATPTALNWDEINGERIAAAVFREMGVDPAVAGATVTAEQFNDGVDRLFGDVEGQTLDDARQQVEIFGTDGKMTVAQMGAAFDDAMIHIDGVAGEGYVRIAAHSAEAPNHHHDSWWDTMLKYVEGGAKDAIATISKYAGMAEEEVAKILNGVVTAAEAEAMGADKIVMGLIQAVQAGEAEAVGLLEKLGNLVKTTFVNLSDQAKTFVDELVDAAQTTGEKAAITFLIQMAGSAGGAVEGFIEKIATKAALFRNFTSMSPEDLKALVPDYDTLVADATYSYSTFKSMIEGDPAAARQLQDAGYTLGEKGLVHRGRVLSEDETKQAFNDVRIDFAIELNYAGMNGLQLNGVQARAFLAVSIDSNGKVSTSIRLRIMEEVGAAGNVGPFGVDAGVLAIHDLVVPFDQSGVKWNSTYGIVAEGDIAGSVKTGTLSDEMSNVLDFGADGAPFVFPRVSPGGNAKPLDNMDVESGVAAGVTFSYDISKMGGESWLYGLIGIESAGYVAGGALGALAIGVGFAIDAPAAAALAAKYGVSFEHFMMMLGGLGADYIASKSFGPDVVETSFGASWWAAGRYSQLPGDSGLDALLPEAVKRRYRFQFNWSPFGTTFPI